MGPFNVTIEVTVKKKIQTLNDLGHGWVLWARSYHYTITEQSRSISHIPDPLVPHIGGQQTHEEKE